MLQPRRRPAGNQEGLRDRRMAPPDQPLPSTSPLLTSIRRRPRRLAAAITTVVVRPLPPASPASSPRPSLDASCPTAAAPAPWPPSTPSSAPPPPPPSPAAGVAVTAAWCGTVMIDPPPCPKTSGTRIRRVTRSATNRKACCGDASPHCSTSVSASARQGARNQQPHLRPRHRPAFSHGRPLRRLYPARPAPEPRLPRRRRSRRRPSSAAGPAPRPRSQRLPAPSSSAAAAASGKRLHNRPEKRRGLPHAARAPQRVRRQAPHGSDSAVGQQAAHEVGAAGGAPLRLLVLGRLLLQLRRGGNATQTAASRGGEADR